MTAFAAATIGLIMDRARARHWSFGGVQMPDGAIVQMVNERQRQVLLFVIAEAEPLVGETQEIATLAQGVPAALVAVDGGGVPYYVTTQDDAYGISFDGIVPYINTDVPVVIDPFGASGTSTPGLPLPADLLRIIACTATLSSDTPPQPPHTVDILDQVVATRPGVGRRGESGLTAFINANRLVPVRMSNTDNWINVTAIQLSLVTCPVLSVLTDPITLPDPLMPLLTALVVEFLATAAKDCPENDKRRFERQRGEAEAAVRDTAIKILGAVTRSSVRYVRA